MKRYKFIVVFILVWIGILIQSVFPYTLGEEMTIFKGVSVISNGIYMADPDATLKQAPYQCVELIKRFYYEAIGINLYKPIDKARNYYVYYGSGVVSFVDTEGKPYSIDFSYLRNSGLLKYENIGANAPQIGDIIVYDDPSHAVGHVGLMSSDYAYSVEQNWSTTGEFQLTMNILDGVYSISDRGTYPILGWLHMPVGEFANDEVLRNGTPIAKGWHFDSDISGQSDHYNLNSKPFTVCYQTNGGRNIFGDSINKVHRFPDEDSPYMLPSPYYYMRFAWVQDFSNQDTSKTHTLVVNEYVLNMNTGYMGVAYWLEGPIRNYFFNHYWEIGYPVSNMYPYAGGYSSDPLRYMVQWFERLDEEYYVVIYDTWENRVWHESEQVTGVPRDEHLNQDLIKNSTPISEGIGGATGEYVFKSSAICQSVTNNAPEGKTYDFHPEDGYVGIWSEIDDIYGSLNISWKWYKPNGELYGECEHISDAPTDGYWHSFKSWRFMDISGLMEYGIWKVELYVNGTKVDTKYFSLSESDSGDPVPAAITPVQNFQVLE